MKTKCLFILLLVTASFSQVQAQSEAQNRELTVVSQLESMPVTLLSINNTKETPFYALKKSTLNRKLNSKIKGQINLFKMKKSNKLC